MGIDSVRTLLFLLALFCLLFQEAVCLSNSPLLGIRLNKVFTATHSRRQADALIAAGRVAVNGHVVHDMGRRVVPYVDEVVLDGKEWTKWEKRVVKDNNRPIAATSRHQHEQQDAEEYIKFWKPVGVTSTTDRKIVGNLLDALEGKYYPGRPKRTARRQQQQPPIRHRIFSVGRLDKDSSGLLLLTSDGRIPDAVLRKQWKQPKVYQVTIDRPLKSDQHLQQLRNGLVITTDALRGGRHTQVTAPTLPCQVEFVDTDEDDDDHMKHTSSRRPQPQRTMLTVTLTEGRNRQIRVMFQTLGYRVVGLHRTHMLGGIGLDGLHGPGDWKRLTRDEMQWLDRAVQRTTAPTG